MTFHVTGAQMVLAMKQTYDVSCYRCTDGVSNEADLTRV